MNSFRVSNFRLFDNEGAELKLKPVTILTGANSSGKSSFVKAMVVFRNFLETTRREYIKSGEFVPTRHPLDFSLPELRMRGFSGALRRDSSSEDVMSFTMAIHPKLSMLTESYQVTYSFDGNRQAFNELKDYGSLRSIRVSCEGDTILLLEASSSDSLTIKDFKLDSSLLIEFVRFCLDFYFPQRLYNSAYPEDGGFFSDMCDEDGHFSWVRAAETEEGKRLAKMSNLESLSDIEPYRRYGSVQLRNSGIDFYEVFKDDFFDALEKAIQENIVLYFPVLDKLDGLDKTAVREYLEGFKSEGLLKNDLRSIQNHLGSYMEPVMDDYFASDFDSFKDYYRSLENDALMNYSPLGIGGVRHKGKENIIEDVLVPGMRISYDNVGFDERGGEQFKNAYKMLSIVQWIDDVMADKNGDIAPNTSFIKRSWEPLYGAFSSTHVLYDEFVSFVKRMLYDFLLPDDLSRMDYFTDSFAYVRRLHSFEENTHFVQVVSEYLDRKAELIGLKPQEGRFSLINVDYEPDSFIRKWIGKDGLNIGKELVIARETEGLGFYLNIKKEDGSMESLADLGHGVTQITSILLQIETVIMENVINQAKNRSEFFPEALLSPAIIAIEEPEVSLHPCFQSLLADIFYDAATNCGRQIVFLVETHSEYLVRKTQVLVSEFNKKDFKNNPFAVYYFQEDGEVYELGYKETGRFTRPFGPGFFDESAKSMYQILKKEESERSNS